jgi:hypothetical protein
MGCGLALDDVEGDNADKLAHGILKSAFRKWQEAPVL